MPEQPGTSSRDWSFLLGPGSQVLPKPEQPQAPVADVPSPGAGPEDSPRPVVRGSQFLVYAWQGKPLGGADDLMAIFWTQDEAEEFIAQIKRSINAYQIVQVTGCEYETIEEVS